jgi:recombination protein RecA
MHRRSASVDRFGLGKRIAREIRPDSRPVHATTPDTPVDEVEHLFDTGRVSDRPADVSAALASLEARWGAAAPRRLTEGALALVPAAAPDAPGTPGLAPLERVVSTGFAELDAILGPGGLPRNAGLALRGDGSSGRTTLALRTVAEAQAAGSVVAWVDLSRSFDPVEAVARGVQLEWLVVVTPETLDEALAIGGALLTSRSIDVLLLDLPGRLARTDRVSKVADRLHRLAALARRSDVLLILLEPPGRGDPNGLTTAVAEATGLRLELVRRAWIRLGRDVVGQETEALVARSRFGPPGRRATLRILYADGGERDACLRREDLLVNAPATPEREHPDATPPPPLAPPAARAHEGPSLRVLPDRPDDPRRSAVDAGHGHRRQPRGAGARRPPRDVARGRAPTGA